MIGARRSRHGLDDPHPRPVPTFWLSSWIVGGCILVATLLVPVPVSADVSGCPVFPANNVWNARVDTLPVDAHSAMYINFIGVSTSLHPDFGSETWDGGPIGIPYNTVPGTHPLLPVTFYYPSESDPGPYPIPSSPLIEWGSDHHLLTVDRDGCKLYELYDVSYSGGAWQAGSGAIFDLNSNVLRPAGWTSADAAGLPILPGLARYDEVASGAINHALRFTVHATNGQYIWPARHLTASTFSSAPPMGQRFRLKTSFDISGYSPQTRVILDALKKYGMFVADNGADWYISGAPDSNWADSLLVPELRTVHGSDFEAVDESGLMRDPDSGRAAWALTHWWLWLPVVRK